MKRKRQWIRSSLLFFCLAGFAAEARVSRLVINSREVVADGAFFGDVGPYEKLKGTVFFEVDPSNPHNAIVFDLENAPRNKRGNVEFSADTVILRPVFRRQGNRALFFEVNNRGNKISFTMMNDAPPDANNNDPTTLHDFGNGFLQRQGYIVAWVGWGADIAPGANRLLVDFPIAMSEGRPITERILTEFSDRNFGGATPSTLPLSGGTAFNSYPAISTDQTMARAELRRRPSDSPSTSGPEIPQGEVVPMSEWSFANCPDGPPGTPSVTDICIAGGFQNDKVYELRYVATNSPVMGLGYVTSRDFVSFLRYAQTDDEGNPNPARGIDTAMCQGISSSGMYYRDYLYQGFNADEEGRRVCDAVHIQIPGVQKLFLNYRFAQPNPFTVQHRERYVPDTNFPRAYVVRTDPVTGDTDGVLKRPGTDPKVIHIDSGTEWWQFRSSLVDTDEDGMFDLEQPDNLRRYLFSSTQHYPTKGAIPNHGTGDRQCQQLSNVTHDGFAARALWVALLDWVRTGNPPPDSRIPRIDDGTLVQPDQGSTGFPDIPGVTYTGRYNGSGERYFGPRVFGNSGVIDDLDPAVLSVHRVLVPKVDQFGNDLAGIRNPLVEAPIATLTGWNTRTPEFTDGDLCDLTGMTVPLFPTAMERIAAADPRPSLEELYGDHRGYVRAIAQAAFALQAQRLMLQEDVLRYIFEAEQSDVLR
jgi:hypothetical protein